MPRLQHLSGFPEATEPKVEPRTLLTRLADFGLGANRSGDAYLACLTRSNLFPVGSPADETQKSGQGAFRIMRRHPLPGGIMSHAPRPGNVVTVKRTNNVCRRRYAGLDVVNKKQRPPAWCMLTP
jgi:hypothetical protein